MANQYKNKVVYNGTTLIDISDTTAVQSDVASGKSFYTASGQKVLGTGSNGNAISVVDTTDSHGGTIRTITAVDISDTTAIASDVASGKYFYTANGTKTLGTSSGGGSGTGQTVTGTVTGDGTNILEIPCNFAPDLIYVYGDMSNDVANRGVISFTIIKDEAIYIGVDTSASSAQESLDAGYGITGYNESDTSKPHATYSNGVLTINTVIDSTSTKWRNGQIYNYELSTIGTGGGTPSATAHTLYFEFTDETNTTITAYWDDSFISDAITETIPTTYGQKTVTLAQLDGVTWYSFDPTERWETLYESNDVGYYPESDTTIAPYCWIQSLGDVYPENGSVWRITFNGTEYRCTAKPYSFNDHTYMVIGNPKWVVGADDDGTDAPFIFYNIGYGAWSGNADLEPYSIQHNVPVKIERLVTS